MSCFPLSGGLAHGGDVVGGGSEGRTAVISQVGADVVGRVAVFGCGGPG